MAEPEVAGEAGGAVRKGREDEGEREGRSEAGEPFIRRRAGVGLQDSGDHAVCGVRGFGGSQIAQGGRCGQGVLPCSPVVGADGGRRRGAVAVVAGQGHGQGGQTEGGGRGGVGEREVHVAGGVGGRGRVAATPVRRGGHGRQPGARGGGVRGGGGRALARQDRHQVVQAGPVQAVPVGHDDQVGRAVLVPQQHAARVPAHRAAQFARPAAYGDRPGRGAGDVVRPQPPRARHGQSVPQPSYVRPGHRDADRMALCTRHGCPPLSSVLERS